MTSTFPQQTASVALGGTLAELATAIGLVAILLCLALLLRHEYLRAQSPGGGERPRDRLLDIPLVVLLPLAALIILERLLALLR